MRSLGVVVADELGEARPQVPLGEDDEVVEALPAQGPDHPFGDGVGSGRPDGAQPHLDAQPLRCKMHAEVAIGARTGRSRTLPPNDCLRSDDDQVPPPVTTDGADHHPEEPVPEAELRPLPSGPGQDGELLAADEILGHEGGPAVKPGAAQADEEEQVLEHGRDIMPGTRSSWPAGVFRPHNSVETHCLPRPDLDSPAIAAHEIQTLRRLLGHLAGAPCGTIRTWNSPWGS